MVVRLSRSLYLKCQKTVNRISHRIVFALLAPLAPLSFGDARSDWVTFEAAIADHTSVSVQLDYRQGTYSGAQAYDTDTRALDAPVIQLNVPLGQRGEAVIAYPVWRSLRSADLNTGNGGDPSFFTKLLLTEPGSRRGQLAFIWGVLEPAANPPIGPDNLAFYARFAGSRRFGPSGRWRIDTNAGAAIHESDERSRQDDVITLSAALWYDAGPAWRAGIETAWEDETAGRWYDLTETTNGVYRRRSVAATLASGHDQTLFFTIRRGLVRQSGDWSFTTGVEWGF